MNPEIERYKKRLLKIVVIFITLLTLYFTVAYFIPLTYDVLAFLLKAFLPFVLAIIIAILIDPLVDFLESKKIKRGFAVVIALVLLIVVIAFILIVVISRLVIELSDLYQQVPFYTRNIYSYFLDSLEVLRNFLTSNPLPQEAQTAILNSMNAVIDQTGNLIAKITNFLFGLLAGLPGFFTILLVSALATFFISKDKVRLIQLFYKLIPQKHIQSTTRLITHISDALVGFFRAELILISITTVLATIGLFILGIDYAFTIGIIIGFLDLLPVVGPGTLFIPWAIIALFCANYKVGLGLLILYGIISVVRQVIEPKILSQNIGLNPLAVLLALYLGLKLLGIWGIIIGPFVFIIVKGIIESWRPDY
ncbi:MAG: sporulation integral membrane protein YtvI [Clostridia bacterium]|nr:sporulation integral membrane protein YtvI [Clostridia bacterium]